ncbi:haloalkane dehalogenase [Conexibacter sp. SYSU D00693]|uniref:haloalkane dehalogenase n=1 Tax=Conexibacter sp. SYSU D00693 TaxID=2812560 RepID=UPI00196B2ACE|nr:haloalkane dehalogenase [Conexibacter sp. SYSU D00693]
MPDVHRTPDERFADLPGFPYAPHYAQVAGLRLHHLDEGPADAPPVVLLHGEPTWSYLYRKVLPPLLEAGHRCVVPDMPGFGRSDKPTDVAWYSYDRHCEVMAGLLADHLDVRGATLVVQDWGGPVGLRFAVEHPDRVARLVVMDTGLFTGHQRMSEAWTAFRDFVERTEDLPIGMLVRGACATDPGDDVVAAYEAPFDTPAAKAGARAFPLMIPLAPDAPGAEAGQRVLAALRGLDVPTLMLWADGDPILPLSTGRRFAEAIGRPEPEVVPGASHFLQEDAGEWIGRRIAAWLAGTA